MAALILLLLAVCVGQINGAMLDVRPYKSLLLNLHNDYRRKVQPPAANMQAMVWNETLSNEAALWIQRCNFEHQRRGRGENLAFDSNPNTTEKYIAGAMKSWFDEKNLYRLGPQSCGRACHYTQMVWHKTTQVGCAMIRCPGLYAFGRTIRNAWYLACFYDPKGNWVGEKPYEPGTPCSQCLNGQTCDRMLCIGAGEEVCEDKDTRCKSWAARGECQANPNYMTRSCRKSCGICKGPGSPAQVCTDSNRNCGSWAQRGECTRNKQWMIPNCRKSCNACSGGDNSNSGNGSGSGNGGEGGEDREDRDQVIFGMRCQNNSPLRSCRTWSLSGACDRHPGFMSRECRLECGLCRGETVCNDKIDCCADLKQKGYCRRYQRFMSDNCKESCSLC